MSNVMLDHATRLELRRLISDARRLATNTPVDPDPKRAARLARERMAKQRWRDKNRDKERQRYREYRARRRERLGLTGERYKSGTCKKGHKVEGANAAHNTNGRKRCRICLNERQREYKARKRAATREAK